MISGVITAILMVLFIGGWIWVWRPSRKQEFEAAARMPLEDDAREMNP